jgi:hypothetical protein
MAKISAKAAELKVTDAVKKLAQHRGKWVSECEAYYEAIRAKKTAAELAAWQDQQAKAARADEECIMKGQDDKQRSVMNEASQAIREFDDAVDEAVTEVVGPACSREDVEHARADLWAAFAPKNVADLPNLESLQARRAASVTESESMVTEANALLAALKATVDAGLARVSGAEAHVGELKTTSDQATADARAVAARERADFLAKPRKADRKFFRSLGRYANR